MSKSITQIRRTGLTKINQLVRAASALPQLKPAFAEWQAGEIYVCKKTGTYRYRHGDLSKSTTPWSATAEKIFSSPAAFAFAAMVLAPEHVEEPITKAQEAAKPGPAARANIIQMSQAA